MRPDYPNLETLELEANNQVVSQVVKSLCTNVPVSEVPSLGLRLLYSSDTPPDIERSTFRLLLKLTFTNVYFKGNGIWYCQKNGFAIGPSLVVIKANFWVKNFEEKQFAKDEMRSGKTKISKQKSPICH